MTILFQCKHDMNYRLKIEKEEPDVQLLLERQGLKVQPGRSSIFYPHKLAMKVASVFSELEFFVF